MLHPVFGHPHSCPPFPVFCDGLKQVIALHFPFIANVFKFFQPGGVIEIGMKVCSFGMPKSATLFYLAERMPVGTQTVVAVIVVDIDIIFLMQVGVICLSA